jgi:hypothetical protein
MDELYDLPFARARALVVRRAHPRLRDGEALHRHDARLLRGLHLLLDHRARGAGHLSRARPRACCARCAPAADGRLLGGHHATSAGPTANMYQMRCKTRRSRSLPAALVRAPGHLREPVTDHGPLLDAHEEGARRARGEEGLPRVGRALRPRRALAGVHRGAREAPHGGQLSVAPEHSNKEVLDKMKKPGIESYERFAEQFSAPARRPARTSTWCRTSSPGTRARRSKDMVDLALWLKARDMRPRQVQDFIPTPMSMATTMYYTGVDPLTRSRSTRRSDLHEKRLQKALLLYWDPAHHDLTREALVKAGRGTSSARARLPRAAGVREGLAVDPRAGWSSGCRRRRSARARAPPGSPTSRRRSRARASAASASRSP